MAGVKKNKNDKISLREVKLLLSACLFLCAIFIKTSPQPWAKNLKIKMIELINGGVTAEEVVKAAGKTFEEGNLHTVFKTFDDDEKMVYAEAMFKEDLLAIREKTKFPKEEDDVFYIVNFNTCKPIEGTKTSDFGERIHPVNSQKSFHHGLDIAAQKGEKILAFADGKVREVGQSKTYGKYVIIDHKDNFSTLYAHCDKIETKSGKMVKMGDEIALAGSTGIATGNHLHFEIWHDGKTLNPSNYVFY